MNLSETIRNISKELNISCSELARRSGQSAQNLSKKLNKETLSFEEFEQLLKLMGVQMECKFVMPGDTDSRLGYDQHIQDQLNILEMQLQVERLKNKYFANIGYELRTALNTISGGLDIVVNHKDDGDKVAVCIEKIRPSLDSILRLVAYSPLSRESGIWDDGMQHVASDVKLFLNGKKVLLVDDNELNREIVKELLEDSGIFVKEAVDGNEAIDIIKESTVVFDFVLMDIQMPGMNGYEATKVIRKFKDKSKACTPIIAMTASVSSDDISQAMESGMNGFIDKPLNLNKLCGAIQKI